MSLHGQTVLLTGASMGIGESIARALAKSDANLILVSRSEDKLAKLTTELSAQHPQIKVIYRAVDVGNYEAVDAAVETSVRELGSIDILINNAGLALGAPSPFADLKITDIQTMISTNVNGPMFVTHSVLNRGMLARKTGTILNITSVTGLEVPPFSGEAVYHSNKAAQEAFTNALRNELVGTQIKVLALRPGCVATNFHSLRVGHDKQLYDSFFEGYPYVLSASSYLKVGAWPLVADDIAEAAIYMLNQPPQVSIKALDVVPSAQRSLNVFDRNWTERTEN
ncbi:Short-chain dehydrogenase/reductase SDR [Penicillium alfredii]|uniref:Short-chain dehydrogenase/reductase SDR n=1 Tax=Penicillium alfredii TaxID=1506179 RepID=A0A9W9FL83_9EURO|nr:Short-chain dehydrogenase/reductase SDR [Penicillium alfredii]KAJ5102199.1 Short-chain dehydrogenase/reductase SDR [Penicillium alfredii]